MLIQNNESVNSCLLCVDSSPEQLSFFSLPLINMTYLARAMKSNFEKYHPLSCCVMIDQIISFSLSDLELHLYEIHRACSIVATYCHDLAGGMRSYDFGKKFRGEIGRCRVLKSHRLTQQNRTIFLHVREVKRYEGACLVGEIYLSCHDILFLIDKR